MAAPNPHDPVTPHQTATIIQGRFRRPSERGPNLRATGALRASERSLPLAAQRVLVLARGLDHFCRSEGNTITTPETMRHLHMPERTAQRMVATLAGGNLLTRCERVGRHGFAHWRATEVRLEGRDEWRHIPLAEVVDPAGFSQVVSVAFGMDRKSWNDWLEGDRDTFPQEPPQGLAQLGDQLLEDLFTPADRVSSDAPTVAVRRAGIGGPTGRNWRSDEAPRAHVEDRTASSSLGSSSIASRGGAFGSETPETPPPTVEVEAKSAEPELPEKARNLVRECRADRLSSTQRDAVREVADRLGVSETVALVALCLDARQRTDRHPSEVLRLKLRGGDTPSSDRVRRARELLRPRQADRQTETVDYQCPECGLTCVANVPAGTDPPEQFCTGEYRGQHPSVPMVAHRQPPAPTRRAVGDERGLSTEPAPQTGGEVVRVDMLDWLNGVKVDYSRDDGWGTQEATR